MAEQTIQVKINGMTCGHCERTVKSAIEEVQGVLGAKVDHTTGMAEVLFDDEQASEKAIRLAVNETGIYTA